MLYNRGWSAQEIASFLDISESTTRNYIKTIYVKLRISDKKSLAKYMIK
jgi:DNA-binding NarL/FixJ family response regulator